MAKIGIVGDYDSICAFGALGIDTFVADDAEKTAKTVEDLAAHDYAVILITENAAERITEILDKYRTLPVPAIIPIPSVDGTNGLGTAYLRKAVEQAVGSAEMIFGEE